MPETTSTWTREFHQRDAIRQALADCAPDDLVHISDADEIPRAEALLAATQRKT